MSNRSIAADAAEWTARAVVEAIELSGLSKRRVSDETGIPYPTLNRKLAGRTDFTWRELVTISEVLAVNPSTFTPPIFASPAPAAEVA